MNPLKSADLHRWALEAGFDLCGFARAEPLPPQPLRDWISQGFAADMDWFARRADERLDISLLLPGAKTVIALACNYFQSDAPSPIARYARGRDYHATMKDRLKALRRTVRANLPGVRDFAAVDTSAVMEKVWAARAGLGYVAKNGCFVTEPFGSWVVLATMVLDVEVDTFGPGPTVDRCGTCTLCISACPTEAIVAEMVVDAGKCLSYQTIENHPGPIPEPLRAGMGDVVFGCDICQDVCPLNQHPVVGSARFVVREAASHTTLELAAMTPEQYAQWAPGTPLARAQYDGLRRNAAYALGASREKTARPVLEQLASDASESVREAARWALTRIQSG